MEIIAIILCIIFCFILIINIFLMFKMVIKQNNQVRKYQDYEYFRDLEKISIPPIEAGFVTDGKFDIDDILIFLIELEDRKIISIENYNYIYLKDDFKNKCRNMKEYEKELFDFFFYNININERVRIVDLIQNIKNDYVRVIYLQETAEKIRVDLSKKYNDRNINVAFNDNKKAFNYVIVTFLFQVASVYLLSKFECGIQEIVLEIMTFSFLINIILITIMLSPTVKIEYQEEKNKLIALKRLLKEFSTIKDKGIINKGIYEKFYSYAIAFGIAKKFSNELSQKGITNILNGNAEILKHHPEISITDKNLNSRIVGIRRKIYEEEHIKYMSSSKLSENN